jgi:phosphohistidine phosphatase
MMAKTLLLLRHAKSSWKHPELADCDTLLNKRGKRDMLRMERPLKEENLMPDAILSPTAVRVPDTAFAVAKSCGYDVRQITRVESMYASDPEEYLNVLRRLPDDLQVVLVVGHNPTWKNILRF